jgi:hypothetical protein
MLFLNLEHSVVCVCVCAGLCLRTAVLFVLSLLGF